jgi:hypothetical protein
LGYVINIGFPKCIFFLFQMTQYIAEFWNTLTNLWMIVPPLHGLYYAYKYKFERRRVTRIRGASE